MREVYLVQCGSFTENISKDDRLFGPSGIIALDSLFSDTLGTNIGSKSFRRIMGDFLDYHVYHTGIRTREQWELLVFCRYDRAHITVNAIRAFIYDKSWRLSGDTGLERVAADSPLFLGSTDFWWCVDTPNGENAPDWMAFLSPCEHKFTRAILNDYCGWWLKKTVEEQKVEYASSFI